MFDVGHAEGWHYLSMEYVDGETLASLLRRVGRLTVEKAIDVARQLCAGVAAAHDRRVLHRDLKPSNIMIDGRGRVRIMDFGLAVSAGASPMVRELIGTPAYMAPEQLAMEPVTERTDLYSLGLVLFEVFAGRPIFRANSFEERLYAGDAELIVRRSSQIDPAIEEIILRCLECDHVDRPASALAVAAVFPGGDPLSAALAEGRVPSPGMIAAAGQKGVVRQAAAWMFVAAIVGGTVALASRVNLITLSPTDIPKPPEVLAERARVILANTTHDVAAVDSEFWYSSQSIPANAGPNDAPLPLRFVYRQGPKYLLPLNLFHIVSDDDPPARDAGMVTVTLDMFGRLVRLNKVPDAADRETDDPLPWSWHSFFAEAGSEAGGVWPQLNQR